MFSQILVAVTRKPERHKRDRVFITYNSRGQLVRGSYDIPDGEYPVVYVPLFEFKRTVKQLKLNVKTKMSEEERRQRQRESLQRYREKKRREREQGIIIPPSYARTLSDADVHEVRRLHHQGYKNTEIARMKGVSDSLISKIVNNRRRTMAAA